MKNLHPIVQAALGGALAAIVVATPGVDDGLVASEILQIVGAFITGTGLAALKPNRA